MTTQETQTPRERAADAIAALGLSVESVFIPWSQSRNKGESRRTLNWRVTIRRDGRDILSTDYSAGVAYCPAYNDKALGARDSIDRRKAIESEMESGFVFDLRKYRMGMTPKGQQIKPDSVDVLYSLAMDSDAVEYNGFESWAENFGYDTDSRLAECTYRQCLQLALALRAAIGESGLESLRQAFQDY